MPISRILPLGIFLLTWTALLYVWVNRKKPHSGLHPDPAPLDKITEPNWQFSWERDRDDYSLSSEQCDAAFSELYWEIERAADHWQDGRLTKDAVELYRSVSAGARVLLHHKEVRIISTYLHSHEFWGFRIRAALRQIHRAVTSITNETLPDTEFILSADDWGRLPPGGNQTIFALSRNLSDRNQDNLWLMPDFHFWGSKAGMSFAKGQARARERSSALQDKLPKLFWRGVLGTSHKLRSSLLDATRGKLWADVREMHWGQKDTVVPPEDFCDYRFLIYTEGVAYSSRMTYILNCDSVPVVHEGRTFAAHYHHLLRPGVNYIPVSRDFSDLADQFAAYSSDRKAAEGIANNARTMFRERHTTPAASACYWRKLLRTYAGVAFQPDIWNGSAARHLKGITLEEFLLDYEGRDYNPDLIGAQE